MNYLEQLAEIHRLLGEAYDNYFAKGDGHCKSSEGQVNVSFGNYWERQEGDPLAIRGVEIYSYVLGPHRMHYFDTLDEALRTVREWHKAEMEHDYSEDGW